MDEIGDFAPSETSGTFFRHRSLCCTVKFVLSANRIHRRDGHSPEEIRGHEGGERGEAVEQLHLEVPCEGLRIIASISMPENHGVGGRNHRYE